MDMSKSYAMPITSSHTLFAICGMHLPLQCLAQFSAPLAIGGTHVHHVQSMADDVVQQMAHTPPPVSHVATLPKLVSGYSSGQRPTHVAASVRDKRRQPAHEVILLELLPCQANDNCRMTNIWSGSWESNIAYNSGAATHKECPHHGMPCTDSWPLTLLVTFVVDVGSLHGYRAKNSPLEEPLGARFTPLDVYIMHGEGEILPPGPAPPKVARERWPDHVPFIRIADGSHRFVV